MNHLLEKLRNGDSFNTKDSLLLTIYLSIPAILSQITVVVMEYADASMAGRLGAKASASIGLVSTTTWLIGGFLLAVSLGFSVQIAHHIGAKENKEARNLVKAGLLSAMIFSCLICFISVLIAPYLPIWLGGNKDIIHQASLYFLVFSLAIPFQELSVTCSGMLQSSGNMKIPGVLNVFMCLLNILFNAVFIFPQGTFAFLPGFNLGVLGAGLGTALSQIIISLCLLYYLLFKSEILHHRKDEKTVFHYYYFENAVKIALPVILEQIALNGAQIISTRIISPLGNIAIAANSFSVTAEGLCYMPGFGIASAASTIIGQSIGAKRSELAKRLGWVVIVFGMIIMTLMGILMYIFAPLMIGLMSPDSAIRELGVSVLRIEAFAEPLFAAAIVGTGIFRGIGDTLMPTIINFMSMWLIRLPLAYFLAPILGLRGVWIGMALELTGRGFLYLLRLKTKKWSEYRH